ncbi:hypothetical protein [Actinoplanes awajinensis]|nr:hypothetical protein [Actinoplanes awajinensis]
MAAPRHSAQPRSRRTPAEPGTSRSPAEPGAHAVEVWSGTRRDQADSGTRREPAESPAGRPRWTDPAASRPGQLVWQLVTVWVLGGCAPLVLAGITRGFDLGGGVAVLATVMLVVAALGAVALLYLLARATSVVTPLGATPARRLLWAALMIGGGTIAWLAGRAIVNAHDLGILHNGRLTVLLGGAVMLPVAALLTRGWWLRTPAALILLVLAGSGLVAFRDSGPSEIDLRLAHTGWTRDQLRVVTIPGYQPTHQSFGLGSGGDEYRATGAILNSSSVTGRIRLVATLLPIECQLTPDCPGFAHPLLPPTGPSTFLGTAWGIDETDPPNAAIRDGDLILELTGGPGVTSAQLRTAVATARRATDAEVLTALPESAAPNPAEALRRWLRNHT